jgi:hypothetical protein
MGNALHTSAYTMLHWILEGKAGRVVLIGEVLEVAENGGGKVGNW